MTLQVIVDTAMDGRAHGLLQARLGLNLSTEERDSIGEDIAEAMALLPAGHPARRYLFDAQERLGALLASNDQEGECHRQVAGLAEQAAAAGPVVASWPPKTVREIVNASREPLRRLRDAETAERNGRRCQWTDEQLVAASERIARLVQDVPAQKLLKTAVRHELSVSKFTVLDRLVREHQAQAEVAS